MKIDEQRFTAAMLHYRGVLPRYAPDFTQPSVVKFWHRELGDLEPARLKGVFDALMRKMDRFPTLADVRNELGLTEQSDADVGRDVAERIYSAIARGWASTRSTDVAARRDAYVGEIGAEVVRLAGGWLRLSEIEQDNAAIHKAQWRELAGVLVRKARAGQLEQAPTFPALPKTDTGTAVAGLIEAAAKRFSF